MKIIAILNKKGDTAKTATSLNLAAALGEKEKKYHCKRGHPLIRWRVEVADTAIGDVGDCNMDGKKIILVDLDRQATYSRWKRVGGDVRFVDSLLDGARLLERNCTTWRGDPSSRFGGVLCQ